MTAAEERILIGGNHLASALLTAGMNPPDWRTSTYDAVLERFALPTADIWVAWKAIMDWRDGREAAVLADRRSS